MRYKLFGKSGLRVSEICLGTMTFGTEWGWGADYDTSKKVFDEYVKSGGNFIDTANRYTDGTSEKWVGEFIHSERDHFVLATKYTTFDKMGDLNFAGNHRKNMLRSVDASLKRLNTEYIDLLWLHMWDFTTPVEEVMRSFDDLVSQGKVHYIGISDVPAWVVARANTMADLKGWTQFTGLQIEYSLFERSAERDLLPMAKDLDIAVTPWGVIGGGALSGKYIENKAVEGRVPENSKRRSERNSKIAAANIEIAKELGVTPTQLAVKWAMQRNQLIIPIIGARRVEQLQDSLGALNFEIPEEQLNKINEASKIELGFPHEFFHTELINNLIFGGKYKDLDNHRI
jgi:aryl-alcohol dehydrogenase-like predicted oxidoreductase